MLREILVVLLMLLLESSRRTPASSLTLGDDVALFMQGCSCRRIPLASSSQLDYYLSSPVTSRFPSRVIMQSSIRAACTYVFTS